MKRTELEELIRETIVEILSEVDVDKTRGTVVVAKNTPPADLKKLTSQGVDVELKPMEEAKDDEDEFDAPEKEPSKSELKKNASVAKITDALAKVVKDFKATNEEYKKAEGDKKKDLLDKLKDLTEKKKKLEKALKEKEAKL